MKKNLIYRYIALGWLLSVSFISCTKDDPVIPNEGELITTIKLQFTDSATSNQYLIKFNDPDGDGGESPIIQMDTLPANTHLHLSLGIYNEVENPAVNLTEEIVSEGIAHQFFFHTELPGFSIAYADADSLGNPIGIENEVITGQPGEGNIRIILRHQPDKHAPGVSNGDESNAGGETDIELVLPLYVR